jgi:hypothetical protein
MSFCGTFLVYTCRILLSMKILKYFVEFNKSLLKNAIIVEESRKEVVENEI